jgi:5-methylcytosine-specific restriction endonuclease McrA
MAYLVLEKAIIVEAAPGEVWRSATLEIPVPRVVRFVRYVRVPYRRRVAAWSPRAVKERDGHRCAYCPTGVGTTIDHVIPLSRGGARSSYMNTVGA